MAPPRVILVTGATDGLGRRVAEKLAAPGVLLLVHGRDRARGQAVVAAIEAAGGEAIFHEVDFASLDAVGRMSEGIAATHQQIDVIVNNAGIALARGPRQLSADGHELTFAVNHLAPFLLTRMLLKHLGRERPSRVINVASAGQTAIDFQNVMLEHGYDGMRAYCQSKLANIMFAFDLAQELEGADSTAASLHPSTYMDTAMVRAAGATPLSSVETGADAVLALVNKPSVAIAGRYFEVMRETRAHAQAYDRDARRKLHRLSLELTGL
jgi:NAD(P)-dependent dehydrogenase (short-subunit alcohol dehydrogenase family)